MAIVIPIHPPHYHYAKHIIEKLKKVDIYFIFTTQDDLKNFPHSCKSFVLEDYLEQSQIQKIKDKNIFPSIKKLFALALLHKKYEYISCIDAEIKVLKEPDLALIYESRTVIGGYIDKDAERKIIWNSTVLTTKQKYHPALKELSDNFHYYTWWSVFPVYKSSTIPDFLEFIGFNQLNQFIEKLNWFFFENMTYNYYCLLFENFKKLKIENGGHSLEFEDSIVLQKFEHYNLGWVNAKAYNENPDYYDSHKTIYFVYHLDRFGVSQESKNKFGLFFI
jgi:hypothetical protein